MIVLEVDRSTIAVENDHSCDLRGNQVAKSHFTAFNFTTIPQDHVLWHFPRETPDTHRFTIAITLPAPYTPVKKPFPNSVRKNSLASI
jgi:hypothetical protein